MKGTENEQTRIRDTDAKEDKSFRPAGDSFLWKDAKNRGVTGAKPTGVALRHIGSGQLRAACRAKSEDDFIYKLNNVVEETDESLLWLELIEEGNICPVSQVAPIKLEAHQLLRILQTSFTTAKRNAGR